MKWIAFRSVVHQILVSATTVFPQVVLFGLFLLGGNGLSVIEALSSVFLFNLCGKYLEKLQTVMLLAVSAKTHWKMFKLLLNPKYEISRIKLEDGVPEISVEKGRFSHLSSDSGFKFPEVSFTLKPSDRLSIYGDSGCGKTTLILGLLGQISSAGSCVVRGTMSYASQKPWLFGDTVRGNILCGEKLDMERYRRVIYASCLVQDLKSFSDGDFLEINDEGSNVSGGQAQRISLARGLYRKTDFLLLDEPYSALDAIVSKKISERVLCLDENRGILLTSKTKARNFDFCLELKKALDVCVVETSEKRQEDGIVELKDVNKELEILSFETERLNEKTGREENLEAESVSIVFKHLFRTGWVLPILIILLMGGVVGVGVFADYWIGFFGSNGISSGLWFAVFAGLLLFYLILYYFSAVAFMALGSFNNSSLHLKSFESLIRGTTSFFNSLQIGKLASILNEEMYFMDAMVSEVLFLFFFVLISVISVLVVVGLEAPYALAAIPFALIPILLYARNYGPEVKRISEIKNNQKRKVTKTMRAFWIGAETIQSQRKEEFFTQNFQFELRKYVSVLNGVDLLKGCLG
jgi:ABC-type multidrug transport system fused ATPase/permease subunit